MKFYAGVAVVISVMAGAVAAQATPVEYVRVCDQSGQGFFYIPGTDQCVSAKSLVDMQRGLAASFAMTSAPMPSAPGKTSWSLNASAIQSTSFVQGAGNKTGFGASVGHRVDLFNQPFMFTFGYANAPGGFHAGRVGIAGEF
jgi:hypothetical protein